MKNENPEKSIDFIIIWQWLILFCLIHKIRLKFLIEWCDMIIDKQIDATFFDSKMYIFDIEKKYLFESKINFCLTKEF